MPISFRSLPVEHPSFDRLIEAFRAVYVNGDVVLACFQVDGADRPDWYIHQGEAAYWPSFEPLFASQVAAITLPQLRLDELRQEDPAFEWTGSLLVECQIAQTLVSGG